MKKYQCRGYLFIFFLCVLVQGFSNELSPQRVNLINASKLKTAQLYVHKENSEKLGSWNEIIDSVLFMLFRRTELHRGSIRVFTIQDFEYPARWYPDGSFVISTELLDYIDYTIYEQASITGKRIRNIAIEREQLFAPFIAYEVARCALDSSLKSWIQNSNFELDDNFEKRIKESEAEIFLIDSYAQVLLNIAGYNSSTMANWLLNLKNKEHFTLFPYLDTWLKTTADTDKRMFFLNENKSKISKTTEDLKACLFFIAYEKELLEVDEILENLTKIYSDIPHLLRLKAITSHAQYLYSLDKEKIVMPTLFPITQYSNVSINTFLNTKTNGIDDITQNYQIDKNLFDKTKNAYKNYFESSSDESMLVSYAQLLSMSNHAQDIELSLVFAQDCAQKEQDEISSEYFSRFVYAMLLFFKKGETILSKSIFNSVYGQSSIAITNERKSKDFLSRGTVLNSQIVDQIYYIIEGKTDIKNNNKNQFTDLNSPQIFLREICLGDSIHTLVHVWGQPDFIRYSYQIEIWEYEKIGATVLVSSKNTEQEQQSVIHIQSHYNSVLSPKIEQLNQHKTIQTNLRLGDNRILLEVYLGKPSWKSNDCEVYKIGKDALNVIYIGNTIKQMILTSSFNEYLTVLF